MCQDKCYLGLTPLYKINSAWIILNAVEKLSYLPKEEVEVAFNVLDRKMLALFDVEAIDEGHRNNYEGEMGLKGVLFASSTGFRLRRFN